MKRVGNGEPVLDRNPPILTLINLKSNSETIVHFRIKNFINIIFVKMLFILYRFIEVFINLSIRCLGGHERSVVSNFRPRKKIVVLVVITCNKYVYIGKRVQWVRWGVNLPSSHQSKCFVCWERRDLDIEFTDFLFGSFNRNTSLLYLLLIFITNFFIRWLVTISTKSIILLVKGGNT